MKNALKLLWMYLTLLICGLVLITMILMLYTSVLNFVAGQEIALFNFSNFIESFFTAAIIILVLVVPFIVYYRIRHVGGAIQFIFFVVLTLITWFAFLPLTINLENAILENKQIVNSEKVLSSDYFRKTDGEIYYFLDDFNLDAPQEEVDTLVIDTDEEGEFEIQKIQPSQDFVLVKEAVPYNDILIKQTFNPTEVSTKVDLFSIVEQARVAWNKGFTFWLGFLSLGLIFACLYGFSNLFDWRLLNTCLIIFAAAAIYCVNTFYFYEPIKNAMDLFMQDKSFFVFLNKYVDNSLLCLINVVFSLIFTIIGIIRLCFRKKARGM